MVMGLYMMVSFVSERWSCGQMYKKVLRRRHFRRLKVGIFAFFHNWLWCRREMEMWGLSYWKWCLCCAAMLQSRTLWGLQRKLDCGYFHKIRNQGNMSILSSSHGLNERVLEPPSNLHKFWCKTIEFIAAWIWFRVSSTDFERWKPAHYQSAGSIVIRSTTNLWRFLITFQITNECLISLWYPFRSGLAAVFNWILLHSRKRIVSSIKHQLTLCGPHFPSRTIDCTYIWLFNDRNRK